MARLHGRKGKLYVDIAGGGSASSLTFLTDWTLQASTDKVDATTTDDDNKTYLAGMSDAQGTFQGFYDDATAQTYTAAIDGVARKFYLYPSNANATNYFFGTAFFDFSTGGGVASGVTMSGSWVAASKVSKVAS